LYDVSDAEPGVKETVMTIPSPVHLPSAASAISATDTQSGAGRHWMPFWTSSFGCVWMMPSSCRPSRDSWSGSVEGRVVDWWLPT
jgi:hypothetical protein